ncbi:MAG: hypothetical protein RQ748_12220, partial [Elusimicrobiales bacterium]|nr:hypothetical protein [Elusimicrobiales bacterium]
MKDHRSCHAGYIAILITATFLCPSAYAAGSVEDLRSAAASGGDAIRHDVSAEDTMRHGVSAG